MKFISWNVNGLRACCGKGFEDSFRALDADFFCLQETKMQEGQLDIAFEGYRSYWNYAQKKGYSGTAIFSRHEPLSVTYGLGLEEHDTEGRVITLEMRDFYLVTVYTPNSQDELRRLDYRMTWEDEFRAYLLARCRIHRHVPLFLSRHRGRLFLVVLPLQGPREECRVAHRLFPRIQPPSAQTPRRRHPQ